MPQFLTEVTLSPQMKEAVQWYQSRQAMYVEMADEYVKAHGLSPEEAGNLRDFGNMIPSSFVDSDEAARDKAAGYLEAYYDKERPERREALLKTLYDEERSFHIEKLDLSCLQEAPGYRPGDGLTQSELDVLKLIQRIDLCKTCAEKGQENPGFKNAYFSRSENQFLRYEEENQLLQRGVSDYLARCVGLPNGIDFGHAAGEAELAGASRQRGEAALALTQTLPLAAAFRSAENGQPAASINIAGANPAERLFVEPFLGMQAVDRELGRDPMDRFYLDGVPASQKIEGYAGLNGQQRQAALMQFLAAEPCLLEYVVSAYEDEHLLTAQPISIHLDFHAGDQAWKEANCSWLRRLFDWGPFKIETPADRLDKAWRNDSQREQRRDAIKEREDTVLTQLVETSAKRSFLREFLNRPGVEIQRAQAVSRLAVDESRLKNAGHQRAAQLAALADEEKRIGQRQELAAGLGEYQKQVEKELHRPNMAAPGVPQIDSLFLNLPTVFSPEAAMGIKRIYVETAVWAGYSFEKDFDISGQEQLEAFLASSKLSPRHAEALRAMEPEKRKEYIGEQAKAGFKNMLELAQKELNGQTCQELLSPENFKAGETRLAQIKAEKAGLQEELLSGQVEMDIDRAAAELLGQLRPSTVSSRAGAQLEAAYDTMLKVELTHSPYASDLLAVERLAEAQLAVEQVEAMEKRFHEISHVTEIGFGHFQMVQMKAPPEDVEERRAAALELGDITKYEKEWTDRLLPQQKKSFEGLRTQLQQFAEDPAVKMEAKEYKQTCVSLWEIAIEGAQLAGDLPGLRDGYENQAHPPAPFVMIREHKANALQELEAAQKEAAAPLQRLACEKIPKAGLDAASEVYRKTHMDPVGMIHLQELRQEQLLADLDPEQEPAQQLREMAALDLAHKFMKDASPQMKEAYAKAQAEDPRFREIVGDTKESVLAAMKDPLLLAKVTGEAEKNAAQAPSVAEANCVRPHQLSARPISP